MGKKGELSGVGVCLGDTKLSQSKAYWEVEVTEPGKFSVGVVDKTVFANIGTAVGRELLEKPIKKSDIKQGAWMYSCLKKRKFKKGDTVGITLNLDSSPPMAHFYFTDVDGRRVQLASRRIDS